MLNQLTNSVPQDVYTCKKERYKRLFNAFLLKWVSGMIQFCTPAYDSTHECLAVKEDVSEIEHEGPAILLVRQIGEVQA